MSQAEVQLAVEVHPLAVLRQDSEFLVTAKLEIVPPASAPRRPLNLALVIDKSGSMSLAGKMDQAKAAAVQILPRLHDDDLFTLVAFNDSPEVIVPTSRVGEVRGRAEQAIPQLAANGGTDIARPLQTVLDLLRPTFRPEQVRATLLVTDGQDDAADKTLQTGPLLTAAGIHLYAAGIGHDYNLPFLDRLCGGRNFVDHIQDPGEMEKLFESFVSRQTQVVCGNCRLFLTPAAGVRVHGLTSSAENGESLNLDANNSLGISDLAAGAPYALRLELVLTPAQAGRMSLAAARLRYDVPAAGQAGREARANVAVEVTTDRTRADQPNPKVVALSAKIASQRLVIRAERDVANGDIRGATDKLQRATQKLDALGDREMAEEVRRRTETLQNLQSENRDDWIKENRRTTKKMTQN